MRRSISAGSQTPQDMYGSQHHMPCLPAPAKFRTLSGQCTAQNTIMSKSVAWCTVNYVNKPTRGSSRHVIGGATWRVWLHPHQNRLTAVHALGCKRAQVDRHRRRPLGKAAGDRVPRARSRLHICRAQRRAEDVVHSAQAWVRGRMRAQVHCMQRFPRQARRCLHKLRASQLVLAQSMNLQRGCKRRSTVCSAGHARRAAASTCCRQNKYASENPSCSAEANAGP